MRCSPDSLPQNHNLICVQSFNSVIVNVLAYMTSQTSVYWHQWPSHTLINDHATPKIVDALLTLIFKIGLGVCRFLFGLYRWPILCLCITKTKSLFNYPTYKAHDGWRSVDAHFQYVAGSISDSLLHWNAANTSFMIICIQSPPRLPMMQDWQSLTRCWLLYSWWGRECVSLVFGCKCGRYIRKEQWLTIVHILSWAVGYLNATRKRKTWNTEPEIGTDRSSQTRQNPWVDWYGSGFAQTRRRKSGFGRFMNRTEHYLRSKTRPLAGHLDP